MFAFSKEDQIHLFEGVTFPVETAIIGLALSFNKTIHAYIMKVSETSFPEKILQTLADQKFYDGGTLVLLGTYWNANLEHIQKKYPSSKIIIGSMQEHDTKSEDLKTQKIEWIKWEIGPASWVTNFCLQDQPSGIVSSVHSTYGKIIQMLDDRFHSRNIIETQPLFAGLFNYKVRDLEMDSLDDLTRWKNLFSGFYDLNKLMELGRTIVEIQQKMVHDCVEKNARKMNLPNGIEAAVVADMGAFCNLKHLRLHETFPDLPVTVTLHMDLNSHPSLRISLRSYANHEEISARQIAQKYFHGDGSNSDTAGGSLPLDLENILAQKTNVFYSPEK